MLLIDLTHTSHTPARTGIQRVARSLQQHLAGDALPVTRDPFLGAWRALESWELANLADSRGGRKRGTRWPAAAQWRGRLRRTLGRTRHHALRGEFEGLIVPELFVAATARDYPQLFARVRGPRIALFLDAIPLRFPEFTPPATVARFPGYLRELLAFDGIAAISADSRDSLLSYWRWLGIPDTPPVAALPLGVASAQCHLIGDTAPSGPTPTVLCVGTLEGRKNHLALLEACERLWSRGLVFQLRLIGHANDTARAARERLSALQSAGRPLRYDGPASDETIARAYAECAFTVYPSIAEGFGLPVIESLEHGKPCICSARGALGEISLHGGCLALDSVDADSLTRAIERLLSDTALRDELSTETCRRTFKTWGDYARELVTWMRSLPRR